VFCHHGCCEHRLLIKDVRLPHATDVRTRAHYPLLVMSGKKPERKCQVRSSHVDASVCVSVCASPTTAYSALSGLCTVKRRAHTKRVLLRLWR
jgi:hypothetical protein